MPSSTIRVPNFRFTGHYYPEILEDLIQWLRAEVPEISDEDPAEPAMQMLAAFALVGHQSNVHLDLVANEAFLRTARLRSSVRALLQLIDYQMGNGNPATAEIVGQLSRTFSVPTRIVPAGALFATQTSSESSVILFECLDDIDVNTTDVPLIISYDLSADTYTNIAAYPFSPWGTPVQAGDILYIGHSDVQFDEIDIATIVGGTNITAMVWEFYDGDLEDSTPSTVTNNGSNLTFKLNGWLGALNRSGTTVRIKCNKTGAFEDLVSTWDGTDNKITTTTLLGQSSPSTIVTDYTVGSAWDQLTNLTDGTNLWTTAGGVSSPSEIGFDLPQSQNQRWAKAAVGHAGSQVEAYWIRCRIVAVTGTPTAPSIQQVEIDNGKQYLVFHTEQGQSANDSPLGSSNGLANQRFQLGSYRVVDDATLQIFVNETGTEQEWTRTSNFLNSTNLDTHYRVEFDDDGRATIIFGDGSNGKIPAAGGDNVRAEYRIMTEDSGNVGANTIVVNRAGVAYFNKLYNPRPASGWQAPDGSTDVDLERIKLLGPASLRTGSRGVTVEDIEQLAISFTASDGTNPVGRALAIEEGLGPKTVKLVVASPAGVGLSQDYLDELDLYFNGDPSMDIEGVLLLNSQATSVNFSPAIIDVTATVDGGDKTAIETALGALISPVARASDGVSWYWSFGQDVFKSQITAAIMLTTPAPRNVTITIPVGDTTLTAEQLPVVGTLSITVNS